MFFLYEIFFYSGHFSIFRFSILTLAGSRGARGSRGGRGRGRGRSGRRRTQRQKGPGSSGGDQPPSADNVGAWLARSMVCILNVFCMKFSEGRWTCSSPAMAFLGLWGLLGQMSDYCMLNSFKYANVDKILQTVTGSGDRPDPDSMCMCVYTVYGIHSSV